MAAAAWLPALPWPASSPPAFVWVTQQPADLWDVPPAYYLPIRVPSAFEVGKGAWASNATWLLLSWPTGPGACVDWA